MKWKIAKPLITELLKSADVTINGNKSWDIQVHNEQFYPRVLHQGVLGFGESYMDNWWDCPNLDQLFERLLKANLERKFYGNKMLLAKIALSRVINFQTKKRSLEVGEKHYDLGNDLFKDMLDSRMNYTCGFWHNATTLEEAQLNKLELTCQKLWLKPGMRVLDIGCGWGGLAKYAAENYGVEVVGVTISKEQCEYAQNVCRGLPVEIRFQDYRDVNEKFDRVVSLGMFEHVGHLNYRTYMETVRKCMHDDGLFLLHTIGNNTTIFKTNDWIRKYIFPNGMLPSIAQIGKACENLFVIEDLHNFGAYYDKTLMAWHDNFIRHWDKLKSQYSERFYRMWNFYLLSCAGGFRARDMQLWQIVLSKNGVKGGYPVTRPYFEVAQASQSFPRSQRNTHRLLGRVESLL